MWSYFSSIMLNENICKTDEAQSDQQSNFINLSDTRLNLPVKTQLQIK